MHRIILLILISTFIFIDCSGNKNPVIKLGKIFDKTNLEISQETDKFSRDDNFSYSLSQKNPFEVNTITRRFYKGKVYIDMIRLESIDINIKPDTKKIGESIPVREMFYKYGGGNYMLLFIINDSVIAKKAFVVEGPEVKIQKPVDQQMMDGMKPYGTDNAPVRNEMMRGNADDDAMPKRPDKNFSPSEMMRDQR